jgi:transcriptional regulator with PAS, ATPase and Fis domain
VLQERKYEPLGAVRSENTDARIIVATNKDLSALVREGQFREDLYYRINVVRVELPPLRRRKEDIPLLVDDFITRFNRIQRKSVEGLSSSALSLLMAHDWPGNVRELENVVERAFILLADGAIDLPHLPQEWTVRATTPGSIPPTQTAHDLLDTQAIRAALERNGFNRAAAARDLGIHKTTLFRRMRKLGIPLPQQDGRSKVRQ